MRIVHCEPGTGRCSWGTCETVAALGQNGSTWQPVARRVSGLKKAVMVATAQDHTVSATYSLQFNTCCLHVCYGSHNTVHR
jgi:hypothetical protein